MSLPKPDFWHNLQRNLLRSERVLEDLYVASEGLSTRQQPYTTKYKITYKEAVAELIKKFPNHADALGLNRVESFGAGVAKKDASTIHSELQPLYELLQEVANLHQEATDNLLRLNAILAPLSPDYMPELLHAYMTLLCNLVRMNFLFRRIPREMFFQLYLLVYPYVILGAPEGAAGAPLLPPDHSYVKQHISLCSERMVSNLQTALQPIGPRVAQVLESMVFPTLSVAGSPAMVSQSALFSTSCDSAILSACKQVGLTKTQLLSNLQKLEDLRAWALFGMLIFPTTLHFPGEVSHPGAMKVLKQLLNDNAFLPIYRQYLEPLHALFEEYVRPTMIKQYKDVKVSLTKEVRKRKSKESKHLVEESMKWCFSYCGEEHAKRRIYITQQLRRLRMTLEDNPDRIPEQFQLLLAALAFARSEIVWWFRHFQEVVPSGKKLSGSSVPFRGVVVDTSLTSLIMALHNLKLLLLQYRTAVVGYHVVAICNMAIARVIPQALRVMEHAPPGNAELLLGELLDIAQQFGSLPLPTTSPDSDECDNGDLSAYDVTLQALKGLRERWCELTALLFSSVSHVNASQLEANAGATGLLYYTNYVVQLSQFVDMLPQQIDRVCSLSESALWLGKLSVMTSTVVDQVTDHGSHVLSPLVPLQYFPHVVCGEEGERGGATEGSNAPNSAKSMAEGYMTKVSEAVVRMLKELHECYDPARQLSLRSVAAHLPSGSKSRGKGSSGLDIWSLKPDGAAVADGPSVGLPHSTWSSLAKLCTALAHAQPQKVTDSYAVVPQEWMRSAVRTAMQYVVAVHAINGKDIYRPSYLENAVSRLQCIILRLQSIVGLDLRGVVTEVLLSHSTCPLARGKTISLKGVMPFIAEWYSRCVVQDANNWMVSACPSRQLFVSHREVDVSLYANLEELQAIIRVFGVYGTCHLARKTEGCLKSSLSQILGFMTANEAMLHEMEHEYQSCHGIPESAAKYRFSSLPAVTQLVDVLQQMGRALLLRSMLSHAQSSTLTSCAVTVDHLLNSSQGIFKDGSKLSVVDVFDLPRSHLTAIQSSTAQRVDPALVQLFLDYPPERLQQWLLWPFVMALAYWSPSWAATALRLVDQGLLNNMSSVALCVAHVALAVSQAVVQGKQKGAQVAPVQHTPPPDISSRASDPGPGGAAVAQDVAQLQAAGFHAFIGCVSGVVALEGPDSLSNKLMSLDALCDLGFERQVLERFGVCRARIGNAYQQAYGSRKSGGTA